MIEAKYRAVIFDLDGTLADTAPDVHRSMNLLRRRHGLPPISVEEAKKSIGPGPDRFVRHLAPHAEPEKIRGIVREFREIYSQHLLDATRLFPGVRELLLELHAIGVLLAVVTNKPVRFSEAILQGLGVANLFGAVLGPEAVEHQKPAPDAILKAMELLHARRDETLMVGDTEYDIRAAKDAGVAVCAVAYGYSPPELLRSFQPDFLVERPGEILAIVAPARAVGPAKSGQK